MISVSLSALCVEYLATSDLSVIWSTLVTVQLISAVQEPVVTSLIHAVSQNQLHYS
jgi:hypothetical protein